MRVWFVPDYKYAKGLVRCKKMQIFGSKKNYLRL